MSDHKKSLFSRLGLFHAWTDRSGNSYLLAFPSAIPFPAQQKRVEVIQQRLRFLAIILAIAMPAWSLLDALVFPHDLLLPVVEVRLMAGVAFASFLLVDSNFLKGKVNNLFYIYFELGIVFLIPFLLYLFCYQLPEKAVDLNSMTKAIANSYYLLPFVVLSCVCLFPLTLLESMGITSFLLSLYLMANAKSLPNLWTPDLGAAWIMLLLATVAVVSSHSQLRLLMSLVEYSSYDLLTNCLGRRSGEEVLGALWDYSVRQKSPFSVAFVDLDLFKRVNDRFGHKEGDGVLAGVAAATRKALRKSDFVIRWGGDEFLIVMPDAKIEDATRIIARMAETGFGKHPDGCAQTVSVGIAERLNDGIETEDALIQKADARLYQAKSSGRCRAVGIETVVFTKQPEKIEA